VLVGFVKFFLFGLLVYIAYTKVGSLFVKDSYESIAFFRIGKFIILFVWIVGSVLTLFGLGQFK
jgi:hypothetical protein